MNIASPNSQRIPSTALRGALLALSVAILAACSGGNAQEAAAPPAAQVSVAPVLVKEVSQWDEFSGRVEAVESVELRPRVSGYIERVNYREGDEVRKGDVLFSIDSRSYRAELAQAQAQLARALSQAEQGRSEASRAKKLAESQAISTESYEQRRSAAAVAQADVQAARAAVESARLNLEWTQVRAPISGRAGRAMITAGNLVSANDGSVLTTIVSQDKVYVYFDTDESTFLRYAELARKGERDETGVPAQVSLVGEEGFPHAGKVDFLDNQVDRSTGTIRGRALLDNAGRQFTPGLFARVRLPGSGRFNALLIDDKAVLTDQDRKYVYVVDAKSTAQRRDVVLGRNAEGLRIVQSGLKPGDRVIVDGLQKVFFPGMPVQAKAVTMQAAADGRVAMK